MTRFLLVLILAGCGTVSPFEDDVDSEQDTVEVDLVDTGGETSPETSDPLPDPTDEDSEVPEGIYDAPDAETDEDTIEDDGEVPDPCDYYPTWYRDMDMDGYGRDDTTVCFPTQPEGYANRGGDCCDARPEVNPGVTDWFDETYTCPDSSWDYNCNGVDDQLRVPDPSPGCIPVRCDYATWDECESHLCYDGEIACGEHVPGMFQTCMWMYGECRGAGRDITQLCR